MTEEKNMRQTRKGFEYLNVDDSNTTHSYRPYPASNPLEVYVVKLTRTELEWVTEARDFYKRQGVEFNSIDEMICEEMCKGEIR